MVSQIRIIQIQIIQIIQIQIIQIQIIQIQIIPIQVQIRIILSPDMVQLIRNGQQSSSATQVRLSVFQKSKLGDSAI